jgi:uncharacterized protein
MTVLERIRRAARARFRGSRGSHDWEHTERVLALAEHIARREDADVTTVRYAALLHDIARGEEDRSRGRLDHARRGADLARALLARAGVPAARAAAVSHCIAAHRFRGRERPRSLEARVLFDADKLDAIGAVGIGRAFQFAGEVGARLHDPGVDPLATRPYTPDDTAYREYLVKLRKVKARILTRTGARLARERHAFMTAFFRRLNREVDGKA